MTCPAQNQDPVILNDAVVTPDAVTEVQRKEVLLKTGALQRAIFNSANFAGSPPTIEL